MWGMERLPLLTLDHVDKTLAGRRVLDGLCWQLREGECAVILGPSGGGKSVFLNTLLGFLAPDAGQVAAPGLTGEGRTSASEAGDPTQRLTNPSGDIFDSLAVIFQEDALLDDRSVEVNLAMAFERRIDCLPGLFESETDEAIDAALREVELDPARVRKILPVQLSGGMRRRVALARALVRRPRVLVADEPTTGLDPASAASVFDLLARLIERHAMSAVIVTHDPLCASRLGLPVYYFSPVGGRMPCWTPPEAGCGADEKHERLLAWMREQIAEHQRRHEAGETATRPEPLPEERLEESWGTSLRETLGGVGLEALATLGRAGGLLANLATPPRPMLLARELLLWGAGSLPLVAMIFGLLGVISLLQTEAAVAEFGFSNRVPELVALGLLRLAPILTAFLLAGRCGSALAARFGAMRLGRQLDALRTMGLAPDRWLFPPVFWAMLATGPLLALAGVGIGALGASVALSLPFSRAGITASYFLATFPEFLTLGEVLGVIVKSALMSTGLVIAAYAQGCAPKRSQRDLTRAITRTLVLVFLWATLVDAVFSLLFA